jgi:hypothetical protein
MLVILLMNSEMTRMWVQRRWIQRRRRRITVKGLHMIKKQATLQSPFLQANMRKRRPSYK